MIGFDSYVSISLFVCQVYTIAFSACFILLALHEALCHGFQKYLDHLHLSGGTFISDVSS